MTSLSIGGLERGESLRDLVERALSAAIVSGEMPPGLLVSVPTLATQFNVSATPVREAMLNLEHRGFVDSVRNKGFRVSAVNEQRLREIVEVRQLLEPPAMRRLAGHMPPEPLPRLRALADAIVVGAETGDLGSYLTADREFHLELTALLGNPLLVDVIADLRSRTRLVGLASLVDSTRLLASAAEHLELLTCLEVGDGDAAYEIMDRHVHHILGWWAGHPETE